MMLQNSKFQNALRREAQACPPVWFMRQAGRYHRHYQALRSKNDFITLCKDPVLASEVALGPVLEFDFDVSILFSDLLFPLEAFGMGLTYDPGPVLATSLDDDQLKKFKEPEEAAKALEFQNVAMKLTREKLPKGKSLIGFIGGTWTLFTYAVEGAHKGGLEKSKVQLALYRKFCERMVPLLKLNIALQLRGGAEVVMIFDTSAGELDPELFTEIVAPSLKELIRAFPGKVGYYAKGIQSAHLRHSIFNSEEIAGVGFDHRWDLRDVLRTPRNTHGFVQGNFDQSLLFLEPTQFEERALKYLTNLKGLTDLERKGWVAGLGHGVLPGTPEQNVKRYVQLVREVFK
jgi:uroporphyrinogen decarboxylase